ncbi:hypothetical protein KVG88_30460 [Pseudomonas sp. SWRI74]|uniref:Uncharacterized protein n=1 Tax=Pseudomonas azerbaijanoccidentalis TaxID=2842347 RepID=A0ABS6QZP6_9PSED|nr:hypothetical protein [Pseudomonas azerbaijanoccidentalis]MBV4524400.1 hypothetical protein [Pseudomonas azerbaijanoccidentalis]
MRKITERLPKPFLMGLLTAGLVYAVGWVGETDYQQAVASQKMYCEMSARGAWPPRPELNCQKAETQQGIRLVGL